MSIGATAETAASTFEAEVFEQIADLTRAAGISETGWAYTTGILTPEQIALVGSDVDHIINKLPARLESIVVPGHNYRQGSRRSIYDIELLAASDGAVSGVVAGIGAGLKSVVGGLPLGFGQEIALNSMEPLMQGPGHRDGMSLRWTGHVSAGPVQARLRNDRSDEALLTSQSSMMAVFRSRVFRGGTWHQFSNPSSVRGRHSVSVAIL